jgi:hypothetical protein
MQGRSKFMARVKLSGCRVSGVGTLSIDPVFRKSAKAQSMPVQSIVYENFGFQHHSDRQVGAYFVARYEYKIAV